jgi:hypothetical protein
MAALFCMPPTGLSDAFLAETTRVPAGSPRVQMIMAGQAVSTCLESGDPHDDGHLLRTPGMQAEGIVALVVLPIRVNGRSRACLNLASKHVRRLHRAPSTYCSRWPFSLAWHWSA